VDLKCYRNCHLFISHKTIEEDPLKVEGSLEEEGSPEEEDSQEEADTQEVVEYHPEDHLEEAGDHH